MLIDRGILAKESVIDKMMHDKEAPKLPGIPPYIPHAWTIKSAQQIMYDLLIIWKDENKDRNDKRVDDITEFFKFVVKYLRAQESEYNKEMVNMPKLMKALKKVPVLKDIFSPMRKKENVKAIHHFFIDSFALAIALKNNHTVGEYAGWFLDWTESLHRIWVKPEEKKLDEIKKPL